ncbi:heterokaryon incompatibility protein [Grosmannia clavigera kw1407]|uniref:Heterokaryon incompatibility protein n=1 Tax=Grosmannia clavigera (strain kw1407 / UAMH 11150) TaxID=655863 RepID=F0XV20_GROCL|nr:heterokaryon incompatibility protein [Grosmannia clavigera kw1407]EFW98710.1 heterokaryon incompatibility protein [Grosmannia clavigera kw1407]
MSLWFFYERPYLEIAVPDDAQEVLSVRFIVTAHDQGFSGTSGDVPPYEMSFTWFSVYADRVNGHKDPRRLKVQSNYRASAAFRTHDIVWDGSDADDAKTRWLASLRGGDRLQLYPRAFYRAWVNLVAGAEMVVTYVPCDVEERLHAQARRLLYAGGSRPAKLAYVSLSLDRREIRLLEVLPGAYDEAIRCRLATAELASDSSAAGPQFEALSYCWGEAIAEEGTEVAIVEMQGQRRPEQQFLRVSRSVELAIRRLRHDDGQTKRVLWIDSVCINQADLEERAHQVQIMHDIYGAAAQVNVWLGEGDGRACMAMRILRDIYKEVKKCGGDDLFRRMHLIFDEHARALETASGTHTESLYHAMAALFGNSWFRRVWVFQEALAGQVTVVHCGRESIRWSELVAVHALFNRGDNFLSPLHSAPQALMPPLWEVLGSESENRKKTTSVSEDKKPLFDILLSGIEVEATDPRDKMFALLAFGRETGQRMRRLPLAIRPDYTKPVEQVFADLTRWLLLEQRSLDVLSAVHAQPGRTWQALHCSSLAAPPSPARPTWTLCPDGSKHWIHATLLAQLDFAAASTAACPLDLALLDASAQADPLLLRLRGFRVSIVTQITAFPFDQVQQRCVEEKESNDHYWADLLHAFAAIFDPGCVVKSWVSSRVDAHTEKGSFRHAEPNAVIAEHLYAHWGYGPVPPNKAANLDRWEPPRYRLVDSTAVPPCVSRCLMVLSDGAVGLCPSTAREGDIVAVLYGGKVPFLLRPSLSTASTQPTVELVGECLLRGVMHGEFVGSQMRNGCAPEVFSIV